MIRGLFARFLGVGAALAASAVLLFFPAKPPPSSALQPAALVWPHAQIGTIPAKLADGTAYKPLTLLDGATSVGSAPSADGRFQRLLLLHSDGSIRLLQQLPAKQDTTFGPIAAAGDALVWVASSRLWTINLRDARPARLITANVGSLLSYGSQDDLTVNGGRLYWEASDPKRVDVVHVRSVALGGGPVTDRVEAGTWQLSDWPWLVNGAGTPTGATLLRNLVTSREIAIPRGSRLATTACGPVWCQVTSYAADGSNQLELMHPDGSGRKRVPVKAVESAITDVAPLNRFAVLSQAGPNTAVTHTGPLLLLDITTSKVAQLSTDAAVVGYARGLLWWSNGNQSVTVWHTLDLRTL